MRTGQRANGNTGKKAKATALAAVLLLCASWAPCPALAEEPRGGDQAQEKPGGAGEVREQPAAETKAPPAEAAIGAGEMLTVDRCVAIGLANHPTVFAGTYTVRAASSRVGQARSGWYPQITASSGYSKYSLAADLANTKQDQYSTTAALTQTLFDFGKTWSQVTVEQRNEDAARADLQDSVNLVVYNVRAAYYGVLQAQKNRDVFAETVKQFEQHLEQARAFFETGVRSKFDVTKAEVDLSNARLNLIRAENTLRIARVTLNNAMGVPDAPEYAIEDNLAREKYAITLDEAVRRASENRPDLRASLARKDAAGESVALAKKSFFPTLSGNAGYTWQELDTGNNLINEFNHSPFAKSGWNAGVTLTLPLFSGFLTSYQVREAKENYNVAKANEESLRQAVLLDVQRAFLNLHEAEERVDVAELSVRQAQESYDIARGRYQAGVGSIIEETDALVALLNARTGHISALADYKVAEAALKKAMGEQ